MLTNTFKFNYSVGAIANGIKTDMFTSVKNNKDKGKANLFYDVLRINNVPLISSCCNI